MLAFDHLAIGCTGLDEGRAAVEALLGVSLADGGRHPDFGTHNALLSLGDEEYLEVIAIDPDAPAPARPRWFDLDRFEGRPRPVAWIARSDAFDADLARLGPETGAPMSLSRGAYRWRLTVPESGRVPMDGAHPAVIGWDGPHPASRLPSSGCRLRELVLRHPEAGRLQARLAMADPRIRFVEGAVGVAAEIDTPGGLRRLE